jgi:hypothetical protein
MNAREISTEAGRLAAERGWASAGGEPCSEMLFHLLVAREDARRHIQSAIGRIKSNLDRLDETVAKPSPHLNDLGELQQQPAALEAAVGAFCAASKMLRRYLETFPAKGE